MNFTIFPIFVYFKPDSSVILNFFKFQASIEICLEENEENGSNYFRPIQTAAYTPAQRNSADILKLKRGYEMFSIISCFLNLSKNLIVIP